MRFQSETSGVVFNQFPALTPVTGFTSTCCLNCDMSRHASKAALYRDVSKPSLHMKFLPHTESKMLASEPRCNFLKLINDS